MSYKAIIFDLDNTLLNFEICERQAILGALEACTISAEVRAGISSFALANQDLVEQGVKLLAADLTSGEWRKKYGDIHNLTEIDIGYRFIRAKLDN